MLVKLNINGASAQVEEAEAVDFASLPIGGKIKAHESDLEDLLAENVNLIEASGDEDETLLIIGRQVPTATGKTMDLVALDNSGALILIEVKRDARDMRFRKDNAEVQAVRYAASLATLRTVDELVVKLYAPFIEKYHEAERKALGGGRTAVEWARKKLGEFIDNNGIRPERVNHAQKIVLIGAGFDEDTKSAAAWMAGNGLPLRVIEIRPYRLGAVYALDVQQVIPPAASEDYYVDVTARRSVTRAEGKAKADRASRPRLKDILAAGLVSPGDEVWFKNTPDQRAVLTADGKCEFSGKKMSLLDYGKAMSGWGAVNVYDWIIHGPTKKFLGSLREELEAAEEAATEAEESVADAPAPVAVAESSNGEVELLASEPAQEPTLA